ncbi:hypothetical protein AVEN_77984-1 [Araneus ventricosus]|uniref:BEN domain-containing protein n=1 Tax=Araneus ventricosus TaxID=182803 RepID=A0A4Y2MDA2_ARAVE|nr:hypothetical protein AVEN_77984-1 [Araneus ventricosus]
MYFPPTSLLQPLSLDLLATLFFSKLNMCRLLCVSKFVSDLLDVVFARDVLANSSMKGIKGSSKPPLAENMLNDVMSYICEKFTVDVGTVRATVRQKLNVCYKSRTTQ